MSTTLEAELLQAAKRSDWLAFQCSPQAVGSDRSKELRGIHEAEAARLRQRAAWVREMDKNPDPRSDFAKGWKAACEQLTGPIPAAETAPTEREKK